MKTDAKVERFSFMEFSDGAVTPSARKPRHSGKTKEEAPPPPPTFSEEQLKAAEKAAHQKGFLEGEKEGRRQAESEQATVDRKLTELVEKFAARIAPLFENYRTMVRESKENMPKIALAIARKIANDALAQNAQAVIEKITLGALETLIKEPKLAITVHESMGDTLARKVEQLAERLQSAADIVILRDPDMPPADFRVEWHQGSMERRTETLWQEVEKVVNDMSATAARDAEAQMQTLAAQAAPKEGN